MDRICGYVAVGRTTKRLALRTLNSFINFLLIYNSFMILTRRGEEGGLFYQLFINFLLIYNSFMILTRRGEGGGCLKQLLKASTCAALFPSYSFFSCTLYVPPPPCYSILFRHFSSEYLNHPLLPSTAQRTESSTWHKHRTVTWYCDTVACCWRKHAILLTSHLCYLI